MLRLANDLDVSMFPKNKDGKFWFYLPTEFRFLKTDFQYLFDSSNCWDEYGKQFRTRQILLEQDMYPSKGN